MTDTEPIVIALTADQWQKHQEWNSTEQLERRRRVDRAVEDRRKGAMHPENSVVVPAAGVWVCHGPIEYAEYSDAEAEAGWPDDAIWRECPPKPLIGWRVTHLDGDHGVAPNLLFPDDEYSPEFTESAFGNTPEAAIAAARRLLAGDASRWDKLTRECGAAGHRRANVHQPGASARCLCTQYRVRFVEDSATS